MCATPKGALYSGAPTTGATTFDKSRVEGGSQQNFPPDSPGTSWTFIVLYQYTENLFPAGAWVMGRVAIGFAKDSDTEGYVSSFIKV